jgi:hypothetical protein
MSLGLRRYLANAKTAGVGIVPLDSLGYLDFLSLNERPATVEYGSNQMSEWTQIAFSRPLDPSCRNPRARSGALRFGMAKAAPRIVALLREHLQRDGRA